MKKHPAPAPVPSFTRRQGLRPSVIALFLAVTCGRVATSATPAVAQTLTDSVSVAWLSSLSIPAHSASTPVAEYGNRLAGFGAGVTLSAVVLSWDEVLGSSCSGSGPYLRNCRVAYTAAVAVAGGLGAMVGGRLRTESPHQGWRRLLLGTAAGAASALLVSTISCSQEDATNPEYLCGYDGMVSSRAVLGGIVLGAGVSALVGTLSNSDAVPGLSIGVRPDLGFALMTGFAIAH